MICHLCDAKAVARGLCVGCYDRERRHGRLSQWAHMNADRFTNPLVCVCDPSPAEEHRNWGMCPVCLRKPLKYVRSTTRDLVKKRTGG